MPLYLYIFGFNTPEQIERWKTQRSDDEESEAVFVEASSENQALDWGREFSRHFVQRLYGARGLAWNHTEYAHWIERAPETRWSADDLARIQIVRVGEHPPIDGERIAKRC